MHTLSPLHSRLVFSSTHFCPLSSPGEQYQCCPVTPRHLIQVLGTSCYCVTTFHINVVNIIDGFITHKNLHLFFLLCHWPSKLKLGPITSFLHLSKLKLRTQSSELPQAGPQLDWAAGSKPPLSTLAATVPCQGKRAPGEKHFPLPGAHQGPKGCLGVLAIGLLALGS